MINNARWYPSSQQLKDPQSTERSLREVLRMFYDLQDKHEALQDQVKNGANKEAVPAGNTASISRLLGLPIEPSDTTQLADGTVLTYVKASRRFEFL